MEEEGDGEVKRPALPLYLGLDLSTQQVGTWLHVMSSRQAIVVLL